MTAAESLPTVTVAEPGRPPWVELARIEVRRYFGRPAFLIGLALTYAALLPYLDGDEPTDELSMIAPAALLGMVGISVSAHRVWASDRCAEAAGPTPLVQASRTIGHLAACLVPFLAGLGFVLVTLLRARSVPTVHGGYAEVMSDAWVAAVWLALGAVRCTVTPLNHRAAITAQADLRGRAGEDPVWSAGDSRCLNDGVLLSETVITTGIRVADLGPLHINDLDRNANRIQFFQAEDGIRDKAT